MTWQDRLRQASYTSPSGARMTFAYEDVELSFEKKTTAFNFPDSDGTYIQDLGVTSKRFPITAIFHGGKL